MTVTLMKTTYEKCKPKIANYKDYKDLCNDRFWQILLEKMCTKKANTTCSGTEKLL